MSLKKLILLLSIVTLFPFLGICQKNNLNRINLTWKAYTVVDSPKTKLAALILSNTILGYQVSKKIGTKALMKFFISVVIDTSASWIDKSRMNIAIQENLIKHEQGHIDLAIIYARILLQKLSNQNYTISDYNIKIKSINATIDKLHRELNHKYDDETHHGLNSESQTRWNLFFEKALKETDSLKPK